MYTHNDPSNERWETYSAAARDVRQGSEQYLNANHTTHSKNLYILKTRLTVVDVTVIAPFHSPSARQNTDPVVKSFTSAVTLKDKSINTNKNDSEQ